MSELLASYPETNRDGTFNILRVHPSSEIQFSDVGQCFTTPNNGKQYKITKVKFHVGKSFSPVGVLVARLYALSGVYGASGIPLDNPLDSGILAESEEIAMESIGIAGLFTFNFFGTQQYLMRPNTNYCIVISCKSASLIDGSNFITLGVDTSGEHGGNSIGYRQSDWKYWVAYDVIFYVYGEEESLKPFFSLNPDFLEI